MSAAFRLQCRLSGDKAAAAHGGRNWLTDEFGTPTAANDLRQWGEDLLQWGSLYCLNDLMNGENSIFGKNYRILH